MCYIYNIPSPFSILFINIYLTDLYYLIYYFYKSTYYNVITVNGKSNILYFSCLIPYKLSETYYIKS